MARPTTAHVGPSINVYARLGGCNGPYYDEKELETAPHEFYVARARALEAVEELGAGASEDQKRETYLQIVTSELQSRFDAARHDRNAARAAIEKASNLGTLQGVANLGNGLQDALIDTANVGIRQNPGGQVLALVGIVIAIPSPNWSSGMYSYEDPTSHKASKMIGGQSLLFLLTMGTSSALSPAAAAPAVAEATSADVVLAELVPDIVQAARPLEFVDAAAAEAAAATENRGLVGVLERSSKSGAAADFESSLVGASSDVATRMRNVPALRYNNPNPAGRNIVRFDGVDFEELL